MLPGLGKFLGHSIVIFWAWFLHESYAIICLISFPISLTPIEPA